MCLLVKPGCGIEVAEKPILVYKFYIKHGFLKRTWGPWIWEREKRWKYNQTVEACEHLIIQGYGYDKIIGPGFHSNLVEDLSESNAVIPPGAEYCLGLGGEVVANKIIIFSSRRKLRRYLKERG